MVRMLHREALPAEHTADPRVEEPVRRVPTPSAEEVRALVEGPARRPVRWMRWLGLFLVIAAGGAVATLVAIDGDPESATPAVPRTADGAERWIVATQPAIVATPRSADGLDLWHAYLDPKVPRTADGAEAWILAVEPVITGTPHSADGLDRWHSYLDPKVPRSADGAEAWMPAGDGA